MNQNEKKSLFSFLLLYLSSSIIFVGIMLYSYYTNEIKMLDKQCSMIMTNAAMDIKNGILKSFMDKKKYDAVALKEKTLRYGIFTNEKKVIYSDLESNNIDFTKTIHFKDNFNYHLSVIEDKYKDKINVKYIIIETKQGYKDIINLRILSFSILFFSAIFILIIGYLLAKLLLKPVRERILHMDNFIKDSAHELNTPIAVLLTSASTLKQGRHSEKMINYIISSAKQVSHIYNDIHFCAFNDIDENLELEFDLSLLLNESINYFRDIALTKKIIIELSSEETLIKMDKNKTQRIINNLLSNAIKYSNSDELIKVSLKDYVLTVEDFGIGISEQDQKNIFKRYSRGNNIEGGFGIGLDIVTRIVKEYNLKMKLESEINVGSRFSIDFSLVKDAKY
ncbi:MAG: HAMP domain-containing histidine kinase [Campylobacteraceae bacterium]|nr:HAMP domain-containing histidine kinase [Campylobacteraceae bacterium]